MPLTPATLQGLQNLGKYKGREVFNVREFESIKQHLLGDTAMPDDFWSSVGALTDLDFSGALTETEEAPHIEDAVGAAVTGRSTVRPQQKASQAVESSN